MDSHAAIRRIGVMHLVDTLDAGGAERVAVNIANLLPRDRYRSFLCTTRREGILAEIVGPDVGRLRLDRTQRFDTRALRNLVHYIREHRIRILHAHGTSIFVAVFASYFAPYPAVIWHDHYGRHGVENRPEWIYRIITRRLRTTFAVSEDLATWSRTRLRIPSERVFYLPNFVCEPLDVDPLPDLCGSAGFRIVCIANLRPQKDHLALVRSMRTVVGIVPAAHLFLVGASIDGAYRSAVLSEIEQQGMSGHVTLLGHRIDVPAILRACDIGVLSSTSEGLPLALIEYGLYGLPAVATRVGQCPEVLEDGEAGLLVPPSSPELLAEALLSLLASRERRAQLAKRLQERVRQYYSAASAMWRICEVYDRIVAGDGLPDDPWAGSPPPESPRDPVFTETGNLRA